MNPNDEIQIQKAATVGDILRDHVGGYTDPATGKVMPPLSGYQIAEKYGLDTEVVKRIISEADQRLAFVPEGMEAPVDALPERLIEPLAEGEEPNAKSPRGHK